MTRFKNTFYSVLSIMLSAVILICGLPLTSHAANTFESSLSAFPESYKPYLRQLHEKYPKWEFQALKTGLDWSDCVDSQYVGTRSVVVSSSAYTDIFKCREPGYYDISTDTYKLTEPGFVKANKLAISFYMDPRNFLTQEGIFQFEKLSFDSSITVSDVEAVLKNTFMHDTAVSYYGGKIKTASNSAGETTYTYTVNSKKTTSTDKYSEVIYKAGKTYNINPCFLASKIIDEVGSKGSSSVSGTHSTYPGVYNFYNIGAYEGSNPIANALYWASNSATYAPGTYGRPWITPQKSIMGGAEFLAQTYIAVGQYTSYLQKFNVDPNSKYQPHTHQYMSNLSAVAGIAYKNYTSRKNSGTLSHKYVFVVPVYNNMPAQNLTSGTLSMADGINQTATVNTTCNVRTAPTTESAALGIQLPSGTAVEVEDTVFTSAKVFDNVMRYPYWSKIKFTYDGKSTTGYVYSGFLTLASQTYVPTGTYTPVVFKSNKDLDYRYISSDPSVAQITNDKTINFLKKGTVIITAYDSVGRYETVKYNVTSSAAEKNIYQTKTTASSYYIKWDKVSGATGYRVYVYDAASKKYKKLKSTSKNYIYVSNLSYGEKTYYKIMSYRKISDKVYYYGDLSDSYRATTLPKKPSGFTSSNVKKTSVTLSWKAASGATGYQIYKLNDKTGKYEAYKGTTKTTITLKKLKSNTKYSFKVKAVSKTKDIKTYSPETSALSIKTKK